MGTVLAVDPHQKDHAIRQPPKTLQALFTVGQAPVFCRQHKAVKNRLARGEVNAVTVKVGLAFGGVECNHAQNVVTTCGAVKKIVTTFLRLEYTPI